MVRIPSHVWWFVASVVIAFILWLFADKAPIVRDLLAEYLGWIPENLWWIPMGAAIGLLIADIRRTRRVDKQIKNIMEQQRGVIQSLIDAGIMAAPQGERDDG